MPIGIPWIRILAILGAILAILGLVYAYGEHRYNSGYNKSDEKWTKAYNAKVSEDNKKIATLEADSKVAVKNLEDQKKVLSDKLSVVMAEATKAKRTISVPTKEGIPTVFVDANVVDLLHGSTGASITTGQCKDSIMYLGNEFSKYWNQMNAETNRQLQ